MGRKDYNVVLSPVVTTGALSKTQLRLNKEILYKSATPMKANKEKMLGPKRKNEFIRRHNCN